ncbi:MAG: sigma-54-dependent Fis family transcriptional regulator [Ferruginibacter sp.]|nr:sigma-54-dependent Fis family transcriptional regulator [Ferruginibacter sp.]
MHGKILIIDDEIKLRGLLARIIGLEGHHVLQADGLKAAAKILEKEDIDVIFCDVKLPDGNGVDFVPGIKATYPLVEIILLTAYGNIPDGIRAMKNGAFNYILKGDDNDKIIPLLGKAFEKVSLQKRVLQLQQQVGKKYSFESIIGKSVSIQASIALARKVAPTDASVLLLGETGTGKEVFAQAIHTTSKRAAQSFMALNCSAFTKELLESELFGHKAGAFTGAIKDKKGLIEEANNGTLFLDEIGEMPMDLQSKMLRVLETNEFIKVGDTKTTKVSVRIIAATNRNLEQDVAEGKFREDLFYRLNVFTISLPPLRERINDITVLAEFFLKIFAQKTNINIRAMNKEFIEHLKKHDWKGNIRELKNIIERAVILAEGDELTIRNLPLEFQVNNFQPGSSLTTFDLATAEKVHIAKVLHYTHGNKTETARLLNIGLATLYRKIQEYQLG